MKFVARNFRENAYFHVYNQGVGKRDIFLGKRDYETFLDYLRIYTFPPAEVSRQFPDLPERLTNKNLHKEIKLVAYCLMPNHFHFLLKQRLVQSVPKLLKQLTNGALMQGRYRAALVESEFLVLQMVRFIHLNPVAAGFSSNPCTYVWSSINDHSSNNELLNRIGSVLEWERFHSDKADYERGKEKIRNLMIDD